MFRGEHRVGDFQAGRRGGQPGPEYEPVAPVGEIVRQRKGLFGEAGRRVDLDPPMPFPTLL